MLGKRLIPCLDVHGGRVVKGVRFVDLRDAGDPVEAAQAYDAQGADELVFLDIAASHEDRAIMLDVVRRTAEGIYMPLTVGGGVRSLDDIRALLRAGADKVSLNTAALARPALITEAARAFGSQCIVVAIDAKRERRRRPRALGRLHPRRAAGPPAATRSSGRREVERRGRRRDPPHQHGPRRHRRRLRPRAHARGVGGGVAAGDRVGRRGHRSSTCARALDQRQAPTRCWWPRSSTSASTGWARPRSYLRARGVPVRIES